MPYTTETATGEAPAMVCPICGKNFFDIHSFASHMNEHSLNEKKRKAEEEKKTREAKRNEDIESLMILHSEYKTAKKKLEDAINKYEKTYCESVSCWYPFQSILDALFL